MKYVNRIRRILKLTESMNRMSDYETYYDDLWERLYDKRELLVNEIRAYIKCKDRTNKEERKASVRRKKQVELACWLLGTEYYKVIR